jgi:hypothetical protein
MFIAIFTTAKVTTVWMSLTWWMDKGQIIYAIRILSVNRKEWSADACYVIDDLANSMLSERSQSENPHIVTISFIWNVQTRWLDATNAYKASFWGEENVLKLTVVIVALYGYTENCWTVHFKQGNCLACVLSWQDSSIQKLKISLFTDMLTCQLTCWCTSIIPALRRLRQDRWAQIWGQPGLHDECHVSLSYIVRPHLKK